MTDATSATDCLVSIERLSRRFDGKLALDDITLHVPRGGVFGLIGGNGAGKTTLIRHLLGMLRAQSGSVRVFGFDPVANPVELLVLDEPSSGLDPVVRRDILGSIIRTIADDGRTVFFSSHLLDEVEQVADYVAIIHQGRLMLNSPMDHIKATHHRLTLRFSSALSKAPALSGALMVEGAGQEWTYTCHGESARLHHEAETLGARIVEEASLTLDEIFVSQVLR